MERTVLKIKGVWNGLNVIFFRSIGNLISEFEPYKLDNGADIIKFVGNYPIFVKGEKIARQQLIVGKGVFLNNYIMYLENTKECKAFDTAFNKTLEEYKKYLGGIVYKNIFDCYNIAIVKFILSMYKNMVYSEELVKQKLLKYMSLEGVKEVMSEFENECKKESA